MHFVADSTTMVPNSGSDGFATCGPHARTGESFYVEAVEETLSEDQSAAVEAVTKGLSLFITGSAGTGKTKVLREVIKALPEETTYVTALTGMAASLLPRGITLHSFMGLANQSNFRSVDELESTIVDDSAASRERSPRGLIVRHKLTPAVDLCGRAGFKDPWSMILENPRLTRRLEKCRLLIVDECSMCSSYLFDFLNRLFQCARGIEDKPFGGVQLLFSGDFYQLPPIGDEGKYCFESALWNKSFDIQMNMMQPFRHREDELYRICEVLRKSGSLQE